MPPWSYTIEISSLIQRMSKGKHNAPGFREFSVVIPATAVLYYCGICIALYAGKHIQCLHLSNSVRPLPRGDIIPEELHWTCCPAYRAAFIILIEEKIYPAYRAAF